MDLVRRICVGARTHAVITAILVLMLFPLTACSGQSASGANDARALRPADVNASDVMFVQMMIPHHQQAVEMAGLVPTRSSDARVEALARRIASAQGPEIDQMRSWLGEWGVVEMTNHAGHVSAGSMKGILTSEQMSRLEAANGAAFDRLFLTLMIEHHEGAVDMAQDGLANGEHKSVLALERAIVSAQKDEIAEMRALLSA